MAATVYLETSADTLVGTINNSNKVFTVSHVPAPTTIISWINGIPVSNTSLSTAITLGTAPLVGQVVSIRYLDTEEVASSGDLSAQTIIQAAMQELGVLAQGVNASSANLAWGIEKLNDMIDLWNTNNIIVPYIDNIPYAIASSKTSYTIGPSGADFTGKRPIKIEGANWINTSGDKYSLECINVDSYFNEPKLTSGTIPSRLYYKPTYPLGTIYLIPYPSGAGGYLEIWANNQLSQFSDLTTTYSLPQGYRLPIKSNLAVSLAPSFQVEVSPMLAATANNSLLAIKSMNTRAVPVYSDLPGSWSCPMTFDTDTMGWK
jgi:hypothetical protein